MATIMKDISNRNESISAYGTARSTGKGAPLSPKELENIDAYWRANPYRRLGMLYLQENPLLREHLPVGQNKPPPPGPPGSAAAPPSAPFPPKLPTTTYPI